MDCFGFGLGNGLGFDGFGVSGVLGGSGAISINTSSASTVPSMGLSDK